MKRTTILADDALMLEVKHLAQQSGCTMTEIIQAALRDYVQARRKPRSISCAGIAASGKTDVAERAEEILMEDARRNEGWEWH